MTDHDEVVRGRLRLQQLKAELEHFYTGYTASLGGVEINFQGELHKYACIRLAGFLEQVFHVAISTHVKASASPASSAFALSFWKSAPNLNPDALKRLVERFDDDSLSSSLATLVDEHNIMERLGTLLRVRNDASHGKSYSGTTANVSTHKSTVDEMYRWVVSSFL